MQRRASPVRNIFLYIFQYRKSLLKVTSPFLSQYCSLAHSRASVLPSRISYVTLRTKNKSASYARIAVFQPRALTYIFIYFWQYKSLQESFSHKYCLRAFARASLALVTLFGREHSKKSTFAPCAPPRIARASLSCDSVIFLSVRPFQRNILQNTFLFWRDTL